MEAIARDPSVMRHAGREGDGPEAADDRRRPDGRAGRADARDGAGAARAVRRPPAGRAHPHRRARVLRRPGRSPSRMGDDMGELDEQTALRLRDPGHPRRPGARPATGAVVHADHAVDHVRPGRRRRPQGLRVLALAATRPAPRSRRCLASLERRATAWPSPAAWPPRTTCCACCSRASASCSATTRTAARSG